MVKFYRRHVRGDGYGVIHKTTGHRLAGLVVDHFLAQYAAYALHDAADHLRVGEQRIDHAAAIVHDDVALQRHHTGGRVYADHHGVRRARIGHGRRHKIRRVGEQPVTGRALLEHHLCRRLRHLGDGHGALRDTLCANLPVDQFEIGHGRFHQAGSDFKRAIFYIERRFVDGIAGGDGTATGDGADAVGDGRGITADHINGVKGHAQRISGDLRIHGAMPLALAACAGRHLHAP